MAGIRHKLLFLFNILINYDGKNEEDNTKNNF